MLVSSHDVHDCQIRSSFYKQSGNTGTDFACTETKGEVVIEMSGKFGFKWLKWWKQKGKLLIIGHTIIKLWKEALTSTI